MQCDGDGVVAAGAFSVMRTGHTTANGHWPYRGLKLTTGFGLSIGDLDLLHCPFKHEFVAPAVSCGGTDTIKAVAFFAKVNRLIGRFEVC